MIENTAFVQRLDELLREFREAAWVSGRWSNEETEANDAQSTLRAFVLDAVRRAEGQTTLPTTHRSIP